MGQQRNRYDAVDNENPNQRRHDCPNLIAEIDPNAVFATSSKCTLPRFVIVGIFIIYCFGVQFWSSTSIARARRAYSFHNRSFVSFLWEILNRITAGKAMLHETWFQLALMRIWQTWRLGTIRHNDTSNDIGVHLSQTQIAYLRGWRSPSRARG